jgi:hypothetical protein
MLDQRWPTGGPRLDLLRAPPSHSLFSQNLNLTTERGIFPVLWRVIANFKAFDSSFFNYNCFSRMYETKHDLENVSFRKIALG